MQIDTASDGVSPDANTSLSSQRVMPTPSNVGDRLKIWRRSCGATQKEWADSLGVDVGTLRKYELGLNVPGGLFLARLCLHGLSINWLLLGQGAMNTSPNEKSMPSHTLTRITELANAMEVLRNSDIDKFDMLLSGFVARCREATHFAQLVKQVDAQRDTSPAPLEPGTGPFDAY